MKRLVSVGLAALVALSSTVATADIAFADGWKSHGSWQKKGWHGGPKSGWNGHNNYYYYNNDGWSVGAGIAAGAILGLTLGALARPSYAYPAYPYRNGPYPASAVEAHIEDCIKRFRTYDPTTNLYKGYDGYYHECRSRY